LHAIIDTLSKWLTPIQLNKIKSHRTKLGAGSGNGIRRGFWILPFTKSGKQDGWKHILFFVVPNVRKVGQEPGAFFLTIC
jgi:hypothetical protein